MLPSQDADLMTSQAKLVNHDTSSKLDNDDCGALLLAA
jgi:hypothetical protein